MKELTIVKTSAFFSSFSTDAASCTKSCESATFNGATESGALSILEVPKFIPPADHTSQTNSNFTYPKTTWFEKKINSAEALFGEEINVVKHSHGASITTENNEVSVLKPNGVPYIKGGIHGISEGSSIKSETLSNNGDQSFEKFSEKIKRHNQSVSPQVESCKQHKTEEAMLDSDALELSPQEAANHFLNTINNLAEKHKLSIERVIDYKKTKSYGNVNFAYTPNTTKQNVKEIFVDFILFMEGMLKDQRFNFSDDVGKYRNEQTITNKRVNEIDTLLSEIFTAQEIKLSKIQLTKKPYYYLRGLLSDYLFKNYTDLDNSHYEMIGRQAVDFFEKILFGKGFFSELDPFMRFVDSHLQEFNDALKVLPSDSFICRNYIIAILRGNKKLRMAFNQNVMEPEFNKHWFETLNDMFVGKPDSVGQVTALDHYVNLKLGEELEYDLISPQKFFGGTQVYVLEFAKQMQRLGANQRYYSSSLTFDDHFHVTPFIDSDEWFEVNCTPYHDGEAGAENCLEKVFKAVNEMISLGYINQSSGHKHVDVLSATRGNPAVLLELQREIESNPYLIRAFGNNDKIVKDDESQWYKLFSDYSDMKELAIERMNLMITSYNQKSADSNHEEVNSYWLTDSEKLEKLKKFSEIYSNYVQMSPLQQLYGQMGDVFTNKFMAIGLLHIPGTEAVDPYSTIEFRFFRCPESMQELKLINQFLKAWFENIHKRRIKGELIQCVPDDVKASKDYTAEEVRIHTTEYLQKLGLNPDDYDCFLNKVSEEMSEA